MVADEPFELRRILLRQDGVLSRAQALQFLTEKAVRHRIASERWRVPSAGVYVAQSGPLTIEQRWRVATLATRGWLAGLAALEAVGLKGRREPVLRVLVPAVRRVMRAPHHVRVHRAAELAAADRSSVRGIPLTTPARSLVDAARWAPTDEQAAAVVAACFQQRLATADQVRTVLERLPRTRRRSLVRALVADLAGGAGSVPEVEFLRLCRRAGLPEPKVNASRVDATGRQRYLDAYFVEFGVHVEVDGGQHRDGAAWWADMRRQNDLWIPGDRVLRFPAWVIRQEPREVVDQVRRALTAAGWRPPC